MVDGARERGARGGGARGSRRGRRVGGGRQAKRPMRIVAPRKQKPVARQRGRVRVTGGEGDDGQGPEAADGGRRAARFSVAQAELAPVVRPPRVDVRGGGDD